MNGSPLVIGQSPLSGRRVLAIFLAFFGIIFAVNGVFLYWAVSTYSGVVTAGSYRQGLYYNERIAAADRQELLGWSDELQAVPLEGSLMLKLTDRAGNPVSGLNISGTIGRAATIRYDERLQGVEVVPGTYRIAVGPLDAGSWIVDLQAAAQSNKADVAVFRLRRRLWLNP
jgi:nitrogen fixation protein FixH